MNKILTLLAVCLLMGATAYGQAAPKDSTATVKTVKAVQCKGATKSGQRCKKMTKDASGLCFMHDPKRKEAKK